MAFLGENGTLLDVNERFVELTGYTLSEIRDFSEWIELDCPTTNAANGRRTLERIRADAPDGYFHRGPTDLPETLLDPRASDGTLRFVECTASILDRGS